MENREELRKVRIVCSKQKKLLIGKKFMFYKDNTLEIPNNFDYFMFSTFLDAVIDKFFEKIVI
jgi:hypothetical protein